MLGQDLVLAVQKGVAASGNTYATPGAQNAPQDFSDSTEALFVLNVTAVSGTTPSLTVSLLTYDPVAEEWVQFAAFPAVTAVGVSTLAIAPGSLPNTVAVAFAISGTTPDFTFDVWASSKRRR